MKNYSEYRGVQSQVIFDKVSGQFIQRDLTHDFEIATKANINQPPDALIVRLPNREATATATGTSRKSRATVMQSVNMKRVG